MIILISIYSIYFGNIGFSELMNTRFYWFKLPVLICILIIYNLLQNFICKRSSI